MFAKKKKSYLWDFPGGPVVKTSSSSSRGSGSIPGQGAKIQRAPGQNIKQKPYYNKFNKDFKKIVDIKKKKSLLKIWMFAK